MSPAAVRAVVGGFICFHVLTDAGDDAPPGKEISRELVRLLLRRDVETI